MEDRDRTMDWKKPVGIADEPPKGKKNLTQGCFYREIGRYKNAVPSEFLWAAEDKLVDKLAYEELKCQLPDSPRSTFLMVFSPDGKKVASTHGNHNVYVTDLTTGKNIQTLSGHPRTPWCIAFHPSSNQILASGCLAGQVRVWDLHGGSEVWTAESQSVIASLAFHPVDRMLVIATYNELHFWDWSQSKPFAKCSTKSEREKVRYVSFDRLGNKLITGIANPVNIPTQWDRINVVNSQTVIATSTTASSTVQSSTIATTTTTSSTANLGRAVTYCDSYFMNQYGHLVRRYFDLTRSRVTPTIDRGTDPMDMVDVQDVGSQSEISRPNSMLSTSQSNSNRSLRYRIMRSTCRSYRPPSSRERFRIHSSLLSGLPSRSSSSSNSLVRTTTTTTTTSQSIIFTSIAASTSSCSLPSQISRLHFSLASGRPMCLTICRENSSNLFSMRTTQPPATHSGAVTNPTYTSYSERGIFSTRETNSGDTDRSRAPVVRPYRIIFDDHFRASVHTVIRPSSEDIRSPSNQEQRLNTISPLDRRDSLRPHLLDVEEVELDRDLQRYFTYVSPIRRFRLDSESTSTTPTNAQRPSPQQWPSHNSNNLSLNPTPVPRFDSRPTYDLNNTSPVRRYRDDTDSESSSNTTPSFEASSSEPTTSHSMSPVQLNAGPVPRLYIRPRYIQDQQSQLQSSANPEMQNPNQSLRRQFVLSRHSNSPFQPRIPHRLDSFAPANSSSNSASTSSSCRPEIPSCMSSFVASGSVSTTKSNPSVSLPVGNVASSSSKATNTATTTIAGDYSFANEMRELRNRGRLYIFDQVKIWLRDRIRNSSEHASTDSTVNYSNIASESGRESRTMLDNPLEDGSSSGLGPRGLDPMLSSVSDTADNVNDFPTGPTFSGADGESSSSNTGTDLNIPQLEEYIDPWESDTDTVPFPSSPCVDPLESDPDTVSFNMNPLETSTTEDPSTQQQQPHFSQTQRNEQRAPDPATQDRERVESSSVGNGNTSPDANSELSVRQKIQILSLHIENMQRLCRARIEIVQLQQIRKMWEDLTTQIRSLHTAVQSNRNPVQTMEENENLNSSRDPVNPSVNHLMRLAISDPSPVTESTQTTSTDTSNDSNFYSHFKDVIKSMVNALLDDDEKASQANSSSSDAKPEGSKCPTGSTPRGEYRGSNPRNGESEEPQPGPSGLSGSSSPSTEYFKVKIYKSLKDILNKTSRRRDSALGSTATQRQNRFRLSEISRNRFRSSRNGRQSLNPSLTRITPRDFCSTIESLIHSSEGATGDLEANTGAAEQTETQAENGSNSGNACQSCGHKKKSGKELQKQKRRCTDPSSGTEPEASSSKMMKNSEGGRTVASTSSSGGTSSSADTNSTSELLRKMIERMETMVRFQREAFRRTEELTGTSARRPDSPPLPNSSDDSDSDNNSSGRHHSLYTRNFPRSYRVTRKDVVNLRRAVTQLRARRLLDYMVKSLTEFFEENSDNSASVLDDQIINLYTLLHLALELTDLLLDQLNATSHDLEGAWGGDNVRDTPTEMRDSEWLFSDRLRVIRRLRERGRGLTRSSIHPNFGPNREECLSRQRVFSNPYVRSFSRSGTSRMCSNSHSGRTGCSIGGNGSIYCRCRSSTSMFPGYRRCRRVTPRSTTMPGSRCSLNDFPRRSPIPSRSREGSANLILPSRIANGDSANNHLRNFRFWERRNNIEDTNNQYRSFRSDSNNNSNTNNNDNSTSSNNNNNNNNNNNIRNSNNIYNNNINNSNNSNNNTSNYNYNSTSVTSGTNSNNIDVNNITVISGIPQSSSSLPFSTYLNLREQRPMYWVRYGGNSESNSSTPSETQSRETGFTVPIVQVNDVPVQDVSMLSQPRYRPRSPTPRVPEDVWRWRAWRPRFLHPRYIGPHPFDDQDSNDLPEGIHYYRTGPNSGLYTLDPVIITDAPMSPHHRIQAWDFSKMNIPDISDREANGVVAECKIHNDASVDVSNDGHLLVTLLPSGRLSVTTMLGVYSLDWSSLGQLLYKTSFEQNAVSVSLSPTNRHLLVGLASRPLVVRDRTNMAQIFKLEGARPSPPGGTWQSGRGRLVHMRDLEQTRETNLMSLNCIRWAPGAGQGLVYGTNTGQLKVLR